MNTKLNIIDYVCGNYSRAETHRTLIKGVQPTNCQHIRFLLILVYFLFYSFLVTEPSKSGLPILTIYTSNDAVLRQMCLYGPKCS
jgi:hypothetical protein